jgi:hypothetical protein
LTKIWILLSIVLLCAAGNLLATSDDTSQRRAMSEPKIAGGGDDMSLPSSDVRFGSSLTSAIPDPPGDTIGSTYYEYQKNGSMGRQVSWIHISGGQKWVNFLWMCRQDIGANRRIRYNGRNIDTGVWAAGTGITGGVEVSGINGGYVTMDVTSSGFVVGAWHEGPSSSLYTTRAGQQGAIGTGNFTMNICPGPPVPFSRIDCEGISTGLYETQSTYIWPTVDWQNVNGHDVRHVVSTESTPEAAVPADDMHTLVYYRVQDGKFDHDGDGIAEHADSCGMYIDSSRAIGVIVQSDPRSDRVAIVWLRSIYAPSDPRNDLCSAFVAFQHDVMYMESSNGGVNWGAPVNVTDYSQGGTLDMDEIHYTAFNEVTALYDYRGYLHIVWTTPNKDMTDDPCQPLIASIMWHWSSEYSAGQNIAKVIDATVPRGFCSNGTGGNLGGVSKPNLSECSRPTDTLLYISFVRFGVVRTGSSGQNCGDCSAGGYANGDIMLTASATHGNTWGPDSDPTVPDHDTLTTAGTGQPVNQGIAVDVTNTWTNNCAAGACHSENWPSMAERSDGGLHIFYIDDTDAGGFVNEEGAETRALVKYMTYDCFTPKTTFDYSVTPTDAVLHIAPSESQPSDQCTVGKIDTVDIVVSNNGNVPITYSATESAPWLSLVNPSGTISAGVSTTATIKAIVGPYTPQGEYSTVIQIVIDNVQGPETGTVNVNVDLGVACKYFAPEYVVLSTFCWSVGVWNAPRAGLQADDVHGNMYWFLDSIAPMYDEGVIISMDNDTTETWFSFFDGSDSNAEFVLLDSLIVDSDTAYEYAHGVFTNPTDSCIRGEIEYYVPIHPEACVLIERVKLCNVCDHSVTINVGEGIDWDIPDGEDGVDNRSGVDASRQMVYQYGPAGGDEEDYYGGASFCQPIAGAIALENDIWVHPHSGYLPAKVGGLLARHTGLAVSHPDSVEDLSVLNVVAQNLVLEPDSCYIFCKVKASSLSGLETLQNYIDVGKAWIAAHGIDCPGCAGVACAPGDANAAGDPPVDIDDIVYLINFVFGGGPAPIPDLCCGDANNAGDPAVDIDDIVYLINFVFGGGPAPIPAC